MISEAFSAFLGARACRPIRVLKMTALHSQYACDRGRQKSPRRSFSIGRAVMANERQMEDGTPKRTSDSNHDTNNAQSGERLRVTLSSSSSSQWDTKWRKQPHEGEALKSSNQQTKTRQSVRAADGDGRLLDIDERSSLLAAGEFAKPINDFVHQITLNEHSIYSNHKRSNMPNGNKLIVIDNYEERKNFNRVLVHVCTAIYSLVPPASILTFIALIYLLLFTKLWFIPIIYYSYIFVDAKTWNRGGRRWDSVYKARFWSYLAAYFPIRLRYSREFKLKPNALGFSKLFPGIRSRLMIHAVPFLMPVMREAYYPRGDISVDSASFDYILSQKWKQQQKQTIGGGGKNTQATEANTATGNLLALCSGGHAEAEITDMQTLKIVCATRKGFVKKALIHGAHLVPCLAFGENSIFKKVNLQPGSLLHRLETKWYQLFKFKHPIYYGWFGTMPFKRPITVCMGDPIEVERVAEPSQEQIDHVHSLYIERLRALYEENQDLCVEYDLKFEIL